MADNKLDSKEILFLSLVQSLATSAWIHLGKQQSPVTRKIEVNLDEASFTIDMLEMIREKTKGNLSEQESQILERSLSDLKINFVEEKMKANKSHPESPATEPNKT